MALSCTVNRIKTLTYLHAISVKIDWLLPQNSKNHDEVIKLQRGWVILREAVNSWLAWQTGLHNPRSSHREGRAKRSCSKSLGGFRLVKMGSFKYSLNDIFKWPLLAPVVDIDAGSTCLVSMYVCSVVSYWRMRACTGEFYAPELLAVILVGYCTKPRR